MSESVRRPGASSDDLGISPTTTGPAALTDALSLGTSRTIEARHSVDGHAEPGRLRWAR